MNNAQIHAIVTESQRKITAEEEITAADVENMRQASAISSRPEHRALFGSLRSRYAVASEDKPEPTITESDVKAAGLEAKKTSRMDDRVRYAVMKQKYVAQNAAE